ncbi:MAG: hypothetical protein ABH821_04470 [archaeon]
MPKKVALFWKNKKSGGEPEPSILKRRFDRIQELVKADKLSSLRVMWAQNNKKVETCYERRLKLEEEFNQLMVTKQIMSQRKPMSEAKFGEFNEKLNRTIYQLNITKCNYWIARLYSNYLDFYVNKDKILESAIARNNKIMDSRKMHSELETDLGKMEKAVRDSRSMISTGVFDMAKTSNVDLAGLVGKNSIWKRINSHGKMVESLERLHQLFLELENKSYAYKNLYNH